MAKKGSGNPADAERRAHKARELKKNKDARKQAREGQAVKRDTRELESQIKHLAGQKLDDAGNKRLESLQSELKYVNKAKEEYVKAHPEAKDRVYKQHRPQGPLGNEEDGGGGGGGGSAPRDPNAHLYDEHGKLRDPKRSVYYDPLYNPYGVPPPGMPYREKTPEEESDEDSDDDDEIVMPEGRPPGAQSDSDYDSDDSDYIPLPPGPKPGSEPAQTPPLPSLPSHVPRGPRNPHMPFQPPPSSSAWGWGDELASAPPPQAIQATPMAHGHVRPPPARFNPPPNAGLPPRPGASFAPPPSITPQPTNSTTLSATVVTGKPPTSSKPIDYSAAAIEAAPQIRDLRKEATIFVPRGVKRKQASAPGGVTVNAAPGSGEVDEDGDERRVKRTEEGGGLLGKLKGAGVLGAAVPKTAQKAQQGDDEYQKFLDGLGGLE